MEYRVVCERLDALEVQGWSRKVFAEADGYPLFMLQYSAPAPRPRLLIAAGIHGEEPAGVLGLLDWLERRAGAFIEAVDFTVFPCLNPWGFERGIRYDPAGRDLNREFNSPKHPAVAGFCAAVAGLRFDLFMDLHEDCDFYGMYLYEVAAGAQDTGASEPTLGRRILDACRSLVQLSDGEDTGGIATQDGMIAPPVTRDDLAEWDQWPIALYAYAHHTDHVVTIETPGKQPLELRRILHGKALDLACEHVIGRGRGSAQV